MISSNFLKWMGGFGLLGSLVMIVMLILRVVSPDGRFGAYLDLAGTLFSIFVLIAIYLIHMKSSGLWGLTGFIICLIGTGLWIGVKWVHAFVIPALLVHAPTLMESKPPSPVFEGQIISFVVFLLGWLFIGLLIAQKGYLSRIAGVLLAAAPIFDFIPYGFYLAQPLFAIAIFWISYELFIGKNAAAAHTQ